MQKCAGARPGFFLKVVFSEEFYRALGTRKKFIWIFASAAGRSVAWLALYSMNGRAPRPIYGTKPNFPVSLPLQSAISSHTGGSGRSKR